MESFEDMLNFLYSNLESTEKSKIILSRPIIDKSSGKAVWKNVKEFLRNINRQPEHFLSFISKETNGCANWLSSHKSDGIIFTININQDKISTLMQKYITENVLCKQCNSYNSKMERDVELRKYKIICNDCNSEHYI